MNKSNEKNKKTNYFPLFIGIGLMFGAVFNQVAIGLCLGSALGLTLDYKNMKY